jgi:hypothetical protein
MLSKIIWFSIPIILLAACTAQTSTIPAPTQQTSEVSETSEVSTSTLPAITVTSTLAPTLTPEPTASPEDAYYQSLTDEQKALFNQTKDMQAEGFTRQFLTETGLTNYIAYYDKNGEVAFVWNREQRKLNPAFKLGNNLLVNEKGFNHIIFNPEKNKNQVSQNLTNIFMYVRARSCAANKGVVIGNNTLESALNDPIAQNCLQNKNNLTLYKTSSNFGVGFNVPTQYFEMSGETALIINFVDKPNENMFKYGTSESYYGISYRKGENGAFVAEYYSVGEENLMLYPEHRDKILAQRLARIFSLMFARAEKAQARIIDDSVIYKEIFNPSVLNETDPLIIYSKTR